MSDVEDEHAEEMPIDNQNAPHDSESQMSHNAATQNSQSAPDAQPINAGTQNAQASPDAQPVNVANPRVARQFVQPRQRGRSERILKNKLAKQLSQFVNSGHFPELSHLLFIGYYSSFTIHRPLFIILLFIIFGVRL